MTPVPSSIAATLTDIARDISTLRDPEMLLSSIVRRARLLLGTDIAYLSLNDSESAETFIRTTDGVRTESYAAIRMPLGTGVLGLAAGGIIAETPDYLPDEGKTHLPDIDHVVVEEGVRAILGAPLRIAGKVVGALMTANRTPGAFTQAQREHLEQIASLAAAAVELVGAKESEKVARRAAKKAAADLASVLTADGVRSEIETRLAGELAEHRGLDELLDVAGTMLGAQLRVLDATGSELACSASPERSEPEEVQGSAHEERGALIGDAAPGFVIVTRDAPPEVPGVVASVVARYASIALLYDRTIDDVRHFHENELVSALVSPPDPERPTLSPAMVQRALGTDRETSIAVLVPSEPDDSSRRRLLGRVRQLAKTGHTIVAGYLGRVVIVARSPEEALRARITALVSDLPCFGGIASSPELAKAPGAYAEAAAIASAMRATGQPGAIAGGAEAGVAGLLLRDGDPATARRFLAAHLGPLLKQSRGDVLLATALAYLDANGSINDAAEVLRIHPNTVRQRVDRIDSELDPSWRRGPRRLDTHVALRLWRLNRATASPAEINETSMGPAGARAH
ncbi:GAF domain-containing protein [Microbacterium luteolum]|uniref:Helix-turn-helix domain-containing protein n=2 Tax=Microbacterium luteolum TaxID=69367 RepID=A0ABY7XR20_MICLT|nr:helix-turn-helix domain-containing protein [Microbacterium luteolum]